MRSHGRAYIWCLSDSYLAINNTRLSRETTRIARSVLLIIIHSYTSHVSLHINQTSQQQPLLWNDNSHTNIFEFCSPHHQFHHDYLLRRSNQLKSHIIVIHLVKKYPRKQTESQHEPIKPVQVVILWTWGLTYVCAATSRHETNATHNAPNVVLQ